MKKLFIGVLVAVLVLGVAVFSVAAQDQIKICQVTDLGGVDDKSFNETAWNGIKMAKSELGIKEIVLESKTDADYMVNIDQFIDDGCDLIVTVGFMLQEATATAATDNPDVKFSIIDSAVGMDNVVDQVFQTDEAAFLAGYAAAAMTKTGTVGTYGGMCIPTVTIFMDGFARGVAYYNEAKGTDVKVLGWDLEKQDGTCVDSFDDLDKGKQTTIAMMDQGADIIMPVAGPVGGGTIAAIEDRGTGMVIGVDSDWALTYPDSAKIILTSVVKKMDATTLDVIKSVVDGKFAGGKVVGTLANQGVGIAPFHEFDAEISDELKAELADIEAKIISGDITLNEAFIQ